MEVIEEYIEYLKKEVKRCEEYLDNIAIKKYKYELRDNPNIKELKVFPDDTSDPEYTKNVLRQRTESLTILNYLENQDDRTLFPEYKLLENSLKNSNLRLNKQIEVIKYFISKQTKMFINYDEIYTLMYKIFINEEIITEKSIDLFINGLEIIGISIDYCEKIKKYLLRQIKDTKKEEVKYNFNFNNESKNEVVSVEESKMINDSYDFEKKELKRYISYLECLDYVKIMKKIGINNSDICIFLKRIYDELNKQNPVTKYLELRNKILFYKDKYSLNDIVCNLDEYLNELLNIDDKDFNEAYDYWEDAINDELEVALSYIPRDYKYELNYN